ncbi:MAG TPA: decarboxylating 6-phosphogluconate dehydrogenase [Patescibacteria group bacterium]
MKLAFLGLGKMGSRMAKKLVLAGHTVVAWNRSPQPLQDLQTEVQNAANLVVASSVKEALEKLESPKIVWLMLPAGNATETILQEVLTYVNPGDIVIDGGNSNYKDTQRRFEQLSQRQIKFLGIGVSGGIIAVKEGYPLMVGGDKSAYETITPILNDLAIPHGGHEYFGIGGAGHFVKMVHNGIEYGMMQAIGEGFEVLEKSAYNFDLVSVANLWQKGTIVSSFLIDRAKDALVKDPKLSQLTGVIAASGEADWTIEAAKEENVSVPIIEGSLDYRKESQSDAKIQNSFTAKMVSALRHEFGGHEVKKKE